MDKNLFSERETVALELADRMCESGAAVSDDLYARLASFYSEGEIIELTCAAGLFNYFNRVNDALRIDITK